MSVLSADVFQTGFDDLLSGKAKSHSILSGLSVEW